MTQSTLKREDAKVRILDAAESVFSDRGFDGAAMKAIATRAGVAQGLLHYHFKEKEGLYSAVIARRSSRINQARQTALDTVDFGARDALEQVLHALLRPALGEEGGGAAYARIFGALAVGTQRDVELVREHYDATATKFIDAITRALPGITRANASWGYSFAIASLVAVLGRNGRAERLGGKLDGPEDMERVLARLVRFLAAGLREYQNADGGGGRQN